MSTTELAEIIATVEEIREELHPEIGAAFLEAVVRVEEENPEDDAAAMRGIEEALKLELERRETQT